MPTKSVNVSTTEVRVCDQNSDRMALIFGNIDTVDSIYVSDRPGVATTGIPICPQMVVTLALKDGWDTKAAHYAYCANAKTLSVGEGFQSGEIVNGDGLPHAPDPPM